MILKTDAKPPLLHLRLEDIELGSVIGVGTVGTVYQGTVKATGERVAVKILQQAMSNDPLVKARFSREMEILQRLDHPHIIRYFGGGKSDDKLYFAMELVDGGNVRDLLERYGSLSWQEVASCGRQVCSALQHAHNHGIVHRDIKPGNLFLTRDGQIKLGDFGIARDTHAADLTSTGLTVGTHAYMAPEQITGSAQVNGKADLYALGCVLFEMATGRKPFLADNFAQLFEQHLRRPAPRVEEFAANCPSKLADIIQQLLEKDPEARPFNARSVQGEMIELLASSAPSPLDHDPVAGDVPASSVVDPGLKSLSRKLNVQHASMEVSWAKLLILAVATLLIVLLASLLLHADSRMESLATLRRQAVTAELSDAGWIQGFDWLDSIDSTNLELRRRVSNSNLPLPALLVADRQTAGRGRGSHQWWSPDGCLMLSLAIGADELPEDNGRWCQLALVCGVAIATAVESWSSPVRARLKWPNDVFLHGKKVAGILIESLNRSGPANRAAWIVGIGINLNIDWSAAPAELLQRATCVHTVSGRSIERESALIDLVNALEASLVAWRTTPDSWIEAWQQRCLLTGRIAEIQSADKRLAGRIAGIDQGGRLLLNNETGLHAIATGEIIEWQ